MDKKKQIINAAISVFAKQGLERGKIADIANEAGIGKGTVYEYFKSKDEIFNAIEHMFVFESVDQIKVLTKSDKSPTEKLEEIVSYSLTMHEDMGDTALIIAELWAQHGRGQLHGHKESAFVDMYKDFHNSVLNVLSEGIKVQEFRAMNKEGVAALLLAFIDGAIWQNVIFKGDNQFKKRLNEAAKSFIQGILK